MKQLPKQKFLGIVFAALILVTAGYGALPRKTGAYATGHYRNLFVEAGRSPQEVSAKIDSVYQQFFFGNPVNQAIYYSAGTNRNGPLAYIYDNGDGDVRSEGMSYGMMIAVQLNKKAQFDALWNWAKTHMYHDSAASPAYGFFSWSMKTNGTPNEEMPAPDGEEYFAMSLYFAANRWGNGPGIYNYHAEADRLLDLMKNRAVITGPTRNGTRIVGALFDPENKMARFSPDANSGNHTDPSYQLPAFYELWALWGPKKDRAFWSQAAQVSRKFFVESANPKTGLTPDYANFDGTPWAAPWKTNSVNFSFDSWRTAMNWSVDWAWWGRDRNEQKLSDKLQEFFYSQDIAKYLNEFTTDGKPIGNERSAGLISINAVAGLSATNSHSKEFVEALWNHAVPTGKWRYYDGLLYFMALLHCSGEFQIWMPR